MNSSVSKENANLPFVPGSFWALEKSMESLLIRGGVPVLSLINSKPSSFKLWLNLEVVGSLSGPDGVFVWPHKTHESRYVPLAIIIALHSIYSSSKYNPHIVLSLTSNLVTNFSLTVNGQDVDCSHMKDVTYWELLSGGKPSGYDDYSPIADCEIGNCILNNTENNTVTFTRLASYNLTIKSFIFEYLYDL